MGIGVRQSTHFHCTCSPAGIGLPVARMDAGDICSSPGGIGVPT